MDGLKHRVVKGVFWAFLERLATMVVGFGVTVVLTRLLSPGDYGTVALLSIFIAIADVLVDSGFGMALVQKKNVSQLEFNSVFYITVFMSVVGYCVLYILAPQIAEFYHTPQLVNITRVIGILLIFQGINSIQSAELNRKMLFNLSFRINLSASICSGVVGIVMALDGFGPWALVLQQLVNGLVGVIMRWYLIAWRPTLSFSFRALQGLFSFGWKMAIANIINTLYNSLYGLIIGRVYTKNDLAYINRGDTIPRLLMGLTNGILSKVMFPALSKLQDDSTRMCCALRKVLQSSSFVVFPSMIGAIFCANEIVMILFGNQWLPCVPYFRLVCFTCALYPFHTMNNQMIIARGKSRAFLMLEIVKDLFGIGALWFSVSFGVLAIMVVATFITGPFSLYLTSLVVKRLSGYSLWQQLRDVSRVLLACFVMSVILFAFDRIIGLNQNASMVICVGSLCAKTVIGGFVYLMIAWFIHVEALTELIGVVKCRH